MCPSGGDVAKQLSGILKQLQAGAVRKDWKVDWKHLKSLISEAKTALKGGDHSKAIRSYGQAISFLMDQLRNQHQTSDSSIEL